MPNGVPRCGRWPLSGFIFAGDGASLCSRPRGIGHGALVTVHCRERFPRAIAEIGPPCAGVRPVSSFTQGGEKVRSCAAAYETKRPSSNAPYRDLAQGFDGLRAVADPGLRAAAGPLIWFLKWNLFNSGNVAAVETNAGARPGLIRR